MLKEFPKIFTIGQDYIRDIFDTDVEVTEKIDGSQLNWGKIDGVFYMRSKGKQLFEEAPEKMFKEGMNYVLGLRDQLPDNTIFYAEYLQKPHHNVLNYSRTPLNHLILFGVSNAFGDIFTKDYDALKYYAEFLNIDVVPLLFTGKVSSIDFLLKLLETDSILENTKIEGVVVKNYSKSLLIGGRVIPVMMGKFVSEKFKEVHKDWSKTHTGKGKYQQFIESYRTEARWLKAIQHLKDASKLENSPRDIGALIKAVKDDIVEEEKENIKNFLWKEFGDQLLRSSVSGLPEWYKKYLMEKSFEK